MLQKTDAITSEVKKVIVGKDHVIEKILMVILASGHVLLEDVPGVGKTTLALAFSRTLNLDYKRIQFTSDTMASDIVGFSIYNKQTGQLEYKKGAAFCNLLLADEINRTSPKTQAALLEVMEEKKITVDGVTHSLPEPFICIATQNPMGSAGTQNLPDSQLDRFMVRLSMGYPSLESQVDIIKNRQEKDPLHLVEQTVTTEELLEMRRACSQISAEDDVIHYIARLCHATREHPSVEQGASPRAVMAVMQMSRARAYLSGRDYVLPEDAADVFVDVCCHRLRLTPQARVRKETPEAILSGILNTVKAPAVL